VVKNAKEKHYVEQANLVPLDVVQIRLPIVELEARKPLHDSQSMEFLRSIVHGDDCRTASPQIQ
jgi:hypothetical protein